jgi:uncharacterized protein YjiS (DUF1127 family)
MRLYNGLHIVSEGHPAIPRDKIAWRPFARTQINRFIAFVIARRQRARQLHELYSMSDRELWDVGLSRSDRLAIDEGTYRRD